MSDLASLRAWLAAYPAPDPAMAAYRDGETRVEDGRRLLTMGYYRYGPAFDALWSALDEAGWSHKDTGDYLDVVKQWCACRGVAQVRPEHLVEMDRHTLFNTLRWFQRGERFCDGTWAGAWSGGIFHAGARALLARD